MSEEHDEVFDRANALFDQGKYEEALPLYEELIAAKKLGADPLFFKAECLANLGQSETLSPEESQKLESESITWYDKALDIDDENELIWNGKGNALYHLGDYTKARVCFECAYDIDPENIDYAFSITETCLLTGDFQEASNLAQDALDTAEGTDDVAVAWAFCILLFFLEKKLVNALDTLDQFIAYFQGIESDSDPDNDFRGVDYDFCGMEKAMVSSLSGASMEIVAGIINYLKGEISLDRLVEIQASEKDKVTFDDVHVKALEPQEKSPEAYPDMREIADPRERESIESIDSLVDEFGDNVGFESFAFLFENYDWNVDKGPAPFLEELVHRFFIEIDNGHVKRLSIEINQMMSALLERKKPQAPITSIFQFLGEMLYCPQIEEIYITSMGLPAILEFMRGASFGKGREITLFVNADVIPGQQEDLLPLDKVTEISEIDEIPVDYQAEGKKIVGSMTWTAKR
nr:tetratricopeptide repeat protein [Candidatus Sigynarchaeota archaeon]